jgi:CDP-glucose 4,6-dehydratase
MNSSTFNNKSVLVTGHTGFKGSWLSDWLVRLGANVVGISDRVPTEPNHYELIKRNIEQDHRIDIRDAESIFSIIEDVKPHFVFHLAAQPIVLESYRDPLTTFSTNALGTASILDALRRTNHECTAVLITSDKCYDNVERDYGYHEKDRLGGKDPYSGSKGAAELVIKSYVQSFFIKPESNVRVAVGRAGNVIGGGDWAPYRIIPDCVRFWSINKKPEIRSPFATRPWQHVLEPLSGYLSLACALNENDGLNGEAFNFGPPAHQNHTVEEMVNEIITHWPGSEWLDKSLENNTLHEAVLLQLNCDKALKILNWQSTLNFKESTLWTSEWYRAYYENGLELAAELTAHQIEKFMELADKRTSFKLS